MIIPLCMDWDWTDPSPMVFSDKIRGQSVRSSTFKVASWRKRHFLSTCSGQEVRKWGTPPKTNMEPKITQLKWKSIFQTSICAFHVDFQRCMSCKGSDFNKTSESWKLFEGVLNHLWFYRCRKERGVSLTFLCLVIDISLFTWNPNDPCFDWKRPK